jgi:hypothetical protein
MNIFLLDQDIELCARYHCDQHVVKMILESVQILCTALSKLEIDTPYKPTHVNHPCVLWAGESYDNFLWLKDLTLCLNDEYRYRFDKTVDHRSIEVLRSISAHRYARHGLTPFAQAMPEKYRIPGDAVTAYRQFYSAEKRHFARWSGREKPGWFAEGLAMSA